MIGDDGTTIPAMNPGHAHIVGTGLIGSSVGLALREHGWTVSGVDSDPDALSNAVEVGAIESTEWPAHADITFVASPAAQISDLVAEALERTSGPVTDVGSVKADIVAAIDHPRFVGGHPMAGSEQAGAKGARANLFVGATWVLAPGPSTDDTVLATVRNVVSQLGPDILTLEAAQHDRLVAMVSHVPHLTAATLMKLANDRSTEHRALLRLAAGGFRDMTRIASGRPGIWPDICQANSKAIIEVLDAFMESISSMREIVADGDTDALLGVLEDARRARVNLPTTTPDNVPLMVLRVPLLDRPGELATVTRLATDIDVNIYDIEIAHSVEGTGGVVVMVVEADLSERLMGALMAHGYHPSSRPIPQ